VFALRRLRVVVAALGLVANAACDVELPSGVVRCDPTRAQPCPDDYVCAPDPLRPSDGTFCFRALADGGPFDAQPFDAGELDAGDGAVPDAGDGGVCWPRIASGFAATLRSADEVRVHAVARGPDGTVCVAGSFSGSVVFDDLVRSSGNRDAMVACWSADGDEIGFAQSTGLGAAELFDVAIGPEGTIYAAGYVSEGEAFGSHLHMPIPPSDTSRDFAVVAYDAKSLGGGDPSWAVLSGNDQPNVATAIAIDPSVGGDAARICVGGSSSGLVAFTAELVLETPNEDGVVFCVSAGGIPTEAFTAIAGERAGDTVWDLVIARDGTFYVAGEKWDGVDGEVVSDPWIAARGSGGSIATLQLTSCKGSDMPDAAYALALHEPGDPSDSTLFVAGRIEGPADFGSSVGCATGAGADATAFIASIRADDLETLAVDFIGVDAGDTAEARGIAIDGECVFVSGWFDHDAAYDLVSHGGTDGFVVGYDRVSFTAIGAVELGGPGDDRAHDVVAGPIVAGVVAGDHRFGSAPAGLGGTNGAATFVPAP
jgi:hypothetical protein